MKLVIGNKNYSSWSFRSWLLLSYFELPFEEIQVKLAATNSTPDLNQYSESGRVPVLFDGETVIWDSLAICEYLSERYLDNNGWPADLLARAEARSCCAEMHSGFFAMRETIPMNCRASNRKVALTPELEKDIRRIDSMWDGLRKKYAGQGPWLFGNFSIADCMYAPVVMRFATYDIQVSDRSQEYMKTLREQKHVQAWLSAAEAETDVIESDEVGL